MLSHIIPIYYLARKINYIIMNDAISIYLLLRGGVDNEL